MLLNPNMPRPPPPNTAEDFLGKGTGDECMGTADSEGSRKKRILDREEAAKIIQRSWRKHIVRKLRITVIRTGFMMDNGFNSQ